MGPTISKPSPVSNEDTDETSVSDNITEMIAAAVLATPGVHDLYNGAVGQVATYLPGRRISGIRAIDGGYEVHIVLAWRHPVSTTAEAVRTAVHRVAPGRVDVTIEDVALRPVPQLEAAP